MTLRSFSRELETLVARALPAVVALVDRRGLGSGIVVAPDGYVLTNAHVVERTDRPDVRLSGGATVGGRVVGRDRDTDLAVVAVDRGGLPYLPLSDERPRVGQLVVAIGNPLGLAGSVSLGVVSATGRALPVSRRRTLDGLLQTDAAVNPGNSGGPLLDVDGNVVGVNTARVPWGDGIGFAVPARTAAWVLALLLRHGRVPRPRLGVAARGETLTPSVEAVVGQARAVRVLDVERRAPADRAGLRRGDLLLAANGAALDGIDDLRRALALGDTPEIALDAWREGRMHVVAHPDPDRVAA